MNKNYKIYPSEKDTQRAILSWLVLNRIFVWKQNNVGIKKPDGQYIPVQLKGISDILGILPDGKFLAIEVKGHNKKLSVHQKEFLDKINLNNGIGFVAHSVDEVIEKLEVYLSRM